MCLGINVYLLIQLSTTRKQAKLWTTVITLTSFLVASAFQFLTSYVTLVGCIDHRELEHSGGVFVCADIQPFAGSGVAIQSTGTIATLLPDFFVVRSSSNVSVALQSLYLMVYTSYTSVIPSTLSTGGTYGCLAFLCSSSFPPLVCPTYPVGAV